MNKLFIFILLFSIRLFGSSVDYIGGNITYRRVSGACPNTYFEVTLNLFTKAHQTAGDSVIIGFGDGTEGYIRRTDTIRYGNNVIKSVYKQIHTYGCGSFGIYYDDTLHGQNSRNMDVNNLYKFSISASVILSQTNPHNDSYISYNIPVLKIFKNQTFFFNTVTNTNTLTYDSIVHTLYSSNSNGYNLYIPIGVTINRFSGEIQWANPDTTGFYTFNVKTIMYQNGRNIENSFHAYKFEVINQNPSYIYDSINKVPLSAQNFKEIYYTAGNTYSFSAVYTDPTADSVKMITYPLDFFTTAPLITVTKNNIQKNTLAFSWSPVVADERLYPYNFVLQSISYYPNDSVANSYQTVSFKSSRITGIKENEKIKSLVVYPNPTNSVVNISDEQNELQHATIEITNSIGQTVITSLFNNSLDVSSFSQGCYFLNITTDKKQVLHSKFIKE